MKYRKLFRNPFEFCYNGVKIFLVGLVGELVDDGVEPF